MRRLAVSLIACLLLGTGLVEAQTLFGMVNDFRAARGLPRLTWDGRLAAAAQNQANWMAASTAPDRFKDHWQGGTSSALARVTAQGYSAPFVTEIIFLGGTRSKAMTWWQDSPTHLLELTRPSGGQMGAAIAPSRNNKSAFVIVFGWTGGGGSAASGSGSPAQQPAYVVGLDEHGNIQHEVQPGDDLGTIAWRYYGYNWEVIPTIRALNKRTQDEDGLLAPGDILLIPPKAGTFTPAPADDSAEPIATAAATAPAAAATLAQSPVRERKPGSPLPRATAPPRPKNPARAIRIGSLPTPFATPDAPTVSPDESLALLELGMLALAVVLQLAVIGGAGLLLWRRI